MKKTLLKLSFSILFISILAACGDDKAKELALKENKENIDGNDARREYLKSKSYKKENDEFGEVADDGLGRTNIFLSMTGTIDNPVIKYDS